MSVILSSLILKYWGYDGTLTRLVIILSKLYEGDKLSVKDLAEEFNVSTRTIQKDFNERLVSFPIYQENRLWEMQDGDSFALTVNLLNRNTILPDIKLSLKFTIIYEYISTYSRTLQNNKIVLEMSQLLKFSKKYLIFI